MINRACISINNRCNLNCTYCHFHTAEKKAILVENNMNVYKILDNVKEHIAKYSIEKFKLGFVGNGEPLLNFNLLRSYIEYIGEYTKSGKIASYTITNGILINEEILKFFKKYNINVGFSIDGIAEIHNKYRCNTFETVLEKINLYKKVNGKQVILSTSKTLHAVTSGTKYVNPKSLKVNATRVTLNQGTTYSLKATEVIQKAKKSKKHRRVISI